MLKTPLLAAIAGTPLFLPVPAAGDPCCSPGAPPPAALERIAALAGEWVEVGEDGEPTDRVVSRFRVVAGGTAVLETLFPGSEHEMLTVYHMRGDELVLTHYCVAGNQPFMRARAGGDPDEIVFVHDEGVNVSSEDERHMHSGTLRFLGEDRLHADWRMVEAGEEVYVAELDLARRR